MKSQKVALSTFFARFSAKILIFFFFVLSVHAALDFSEYDLNSNQVRLLQKMEASGKYTEEYILELAERMHIARTQGPQEPQVYIPPHTDIELEEVVEWARGGAFAAFASYANMKFLADDYRADCPNMALFNFGRATGTEYLKRDVLKEALNMSHFLQVNFSRDKENFPQFFLEQARKFGFSKYLAAQ